MDENSDSKTPTEPIQTKTASTNGNDVPKENPTKTTQSTDKAEDKTSENNNQKVNCYW